MTDAQRLEIKLKALLANVADAAKKGHVANPDNIYAPFMRDVYPERKP